MPIAEKIKTLDLKSRDGLEEAHKLFLEYSRDNIIAEVKHKIEAFESLIAEHGSPILDKENIEYIKDIEDLLDAIFEFNRFLKPQGVVEITPWDKIEEADRKWLIDKWLPTSTVTMFTGQGGAGKSWLTLQMLCQIAGGFGEWAALNPNVSSDTEPNSTPNIILATYEDEPAEIRRRLYTLASGIKWIEDSLCAIKQNLHIVDMRGVGSIWGPGMGNHIANTGDLLSSGEQLQHICEDKKAGLLVIDPLSGAFGGNENDRTAVYDFISALRRWGDTTECAVLVIGHLPKYDGQNARFSGSTAWEASVRSMWMLSEQTSKQKDENDDKYWALSHTKSNYAPLQDEIPLIKDKFGWWRKADSKDDAIDGYKNYKEGFKEDTDETGYDNIEL